MKFDGFEWDAGNRDKCQKHGVSSAEIESVFAGNVIILPDTGNSSIERRFRAIGSTLDGRTAFVVFTFRPGRSGELVRPISARYMHQREVEFYAKTYADILH